MRRGVSWAEDLTETISTPPDDDGLKNDFVNDDVNDEDEDKTGTEGCGSEEGQQRGHVGKWGWRRTGAMKKRGRDVLSVLPRRRSPQSR